MDTYQRLAERVVVEMFENAGVSVEKGELYLKNLFNTQNDSTPYHRIKLKNEKRWKKVKIVYTGIGTLDGEFLGDLRLLKKQEAPYLLIVQWRLPGSKRHPNWPTRHFSVSVYPYKDIGSGFVRTHKLDKLAVLPPELVERYENIFVSEAQRMNPRSP